MNASRAVAFRVGGVEAKRRSERVRRRVDLPKPLARLAEGEPRSGPVRRALQRLFENLRRRPKIALYRRGPGVGEAAPGDEIAAGEQIAPPLSASCGAGRRNRR